MKTVLRCCQVYRGGKKMRKIALLSCLVLASAASASAAAAKHYHHHRAHRAQPHAASLTPAATPPCHPPGLLLRGPAPAVPHHPFRLTPRGQAPCRDVLAAAALPA